MPQRLPYGSAETIAPHPTPFKASSTICSGKHAARAGADTLHHLLGAWPKGETTQTSQQNAGTSTLVTSDASLLQFLTSPTQVPTQGQWWSNLLTQLSQTAQWEQRGGRKWWQVVHHLVVTSWLGATSNLMPGFGTLQSRGESHLQHLFGYKGKLRMTSVEPLQCRTEW